MAASQPTHTQPEEWRDIPEYEGIYQVSNQGEVRSLDRIITYRDGRTRKKKGTALRQFTWGHGYRYVMLSKHNESEKKYVHHLVLEAFVGPRPSGLVCCHNDGNEANNTLLNLRWDTPSENNRDRVRHGTHQNSNKTHCSRGHSLETFNLQQSTLKEGRRRCLACARTSGYLHLHPELKPHFDKIADLYYDAILKGQ